MAIFLGFASSSATLFHSMAVFFYCCSHCCSIQIVFSLLFSFATMENRCNISSVGNVLQCATFLRWKITGKCLYVWALFFLSNFMLFVLLCEYWICCVSHLNMQLFFLYIYSKFWREAFQSCSSVVFASFTIIVFDAFLGSYATRHHIHTHMHTFAGEWKNEAVNVFVITHANTHTHAPFI